MLKTGKLDSDVLERIVFDKITYRRDDVLTRSGIGEDCAVIDYGEYECVISTDPITAAIADIGRLAIKVTCNDIASNGIEPVGIVLACMLPVGTTEEDVEQIMEQAGKAAAELKVEIIGGHTEVTNAVNQPVIVSTAVGKGKKWSSQNAENMQPGDYILMTKTAGMEGTGIIARDFGDEVRKFLTEEEVQEAVAMLDQVSVLQEGLIAGKIGTCGMHDVTEGGILGAVWELCEVGNVGGEVWIDEVPLTAVARKICKAFDIDPLRLISSGSMMIIAAPDKKDQIMKELTEAGIKTTCIGRIKNKEDGVRMKVGRELMEVDPPYMDEIYKVTAK